MSDIHTLAGVFAEIARPEILQGHLVNSCIASTWITIEVMHRFNVPARPMTVRANVYNRTYVDLEQRLGRRLTRAETQEATGRHGAWIVGVGFEDNETPCGFNAHLVAILNEQLIVDASIDQANNPDRGITLPSVLVALADSTFLEGLCPLRCDVNGQYVTYLPFHLAADFASSYDWGHNPETDLAVERITNKMHARGCTACG